MKEFDVPKGTFPGPENLRRHMHRSGKILRRITQILNKRECEVDLLDVGCSSGSFLVVARDYGFRVAGVEPAPAAAKTAREMQFVIYEGTLESLNLVKESYDAITMFEVIEHLKDPVIVLKECNRILRPGGIVVICTGNTESWTVRYMAEDWEYFDMEKLWGHISFFNPISVRMLAERTGFEISDLRTRNVRFCGRARTGAVKYRVAKIAGEALNGIARLFGKGHDMLVIMRKTIDVSVV
jgi:SAM-dependent methyltransferase